MDDLKTFGVIIFVLFMIWVVMGGPEKTRLNYNNPTGSSLNSGQPVNIPISIESASGTSESDPQREYFTIINTSLDSPVNISNAKISDGKKIVGTIGKGSALPRSGEINTESDIVLQPGERAYVVSGNSPVGVSFRLNHCSGYFSQFQNFYPPFQTTCPINILDLNSSNLDSACLNYVNSIPQCTIVTQPPLNLSQSCLNYINKKINYNSCVDNSKNEINFYGKGWMVYLRSGTELFKSGDKVRIVDSKNNVVSSVNAN